MRFLLRLLSFVCVLFGLFVVIALFVSTVRLFVGSSQSRKPHVEVIDLSGVIINTNKFLKTLKEIEEDEKVKAVIVRINSPGGLVAPSQEVYRALIRVDSKKPVIASMGALAASGGYYAALGSRRIFANPGTLTGSIGVIMEFANTQKLFQWAKVERYSLKAGKFKDVGSPLREMTKPERDLLEGMLENIHSQFIAAVKERRKLSETELASATDGRIVTGEQAREKKLVDSLGGIEEAVLAAKEIAGIPADSPVTYPSPKQGLLKKLFMGEDEPEEHSTLKSISHLVNAGTEIGIPPGFRIWLLAPVR